MLIKSLWKGCIIMKDLMTEINTLFGMCEEVNLVLKSVDAYGQHKAINKVNSVSMEVFKNLENCVTIIY